MFSRESHVDPDLKTNDSGKDITISMLNDSSNFLVTNSFECKNICFEKVTLDKMNLSNTVQNFSNSTNFSSFDSKSNDSDSMQVLETPLTSSNSLIKTVVCEICTNNITWKSYKRHLQSHRNERHYICHQCGKGFKNSGALSRHTREVHNRLLRFTCDICNASFTCKRTMEEHKLTHSSNRSYVCDRCGKGFRLQSSLNIHVKVHLNLFPFKCTVCSQKFKRKQELHSHISIHTGEKPYKCNVCNKKFRLKIELTNHSVVHSDERSFSCSICHQNFKQKRYATRHFQTKHKNIVIC